MLREGPGARLFVTLAALAAAVLSALYVVFYLRGGPRIIDATSYWLEARAMAEGRLAFPLGEPEASVMGRFLVRSVGPEGARAAVIFPPGYPALLALGFLARAPLAVGPLLGAALVGATYALARATVATREGVLSTPRLAALFSVLCGALRYHTADTMSHGLAALCFTGALAALFHAQASEGRSKVALAATAGLAAGWLVATRPTSALALAVVMGVALLRERRASLPLLLPVALGALPGLVLLALHQHAATGEWGASSQRLYYAASDGPPGCFRYGFGAGVGCLVEHGDFVEARLPEGYGALAAVGTTLRRLRLHALDVGNLEPIALLVPVGAWVLRRSFRGRLLALAVVLQVAAYAPFYFDGNYPGGGARLLSDVLPIEHVLMAAAVVAFAEERRAPERWALGAALLAVLGFVVRGRLDHEALRDREGGRPFFLPSDLAEAGVGRGLVFVDTDHGFNLAFDPAGGPLAFARYRGDALDRMLWEAKGRPPAFLHHVSIEGGLARVTVSPLDLARAVSSRVEGESLWPPLDQRAGWAAPAFASGTCASAGRWLLVEPLSRDEDAVIRLGLPGALAGRRVAPRVGSLGGARGEVELWAGQQRLEGWTFDAPVSLQPTCRLLASTLVPAGATGLKLVIRARPGGRAAFDALVLDPREGD